MKRRFKIFLPLLLLATVLFGFQKPNDPDPEKDKILIGLIRYALTKGHYEPHQIDDDFSAQVFDEFIDALDPYRRFFLQSDINEFEQYKYLIDDQIKNESIDFYKVVNARFQQRLNEVKPFYREILVKPFDFTKQETYNVDYENKAFPVTKAERIQNWQKQLKISTLSRLHDKIEVEEAQIKEGILNGATPFVTLEKEARKSTRKSMDELFDLMSELNDTDWFSVYINTITLQFDPHTNYFAPKDKKRFDISMAGKLEGIGARLRKKDDFTTVDELISGGPAWMGGELEVGDAILKVAQGDGEPVDIVGMRIDDAIEYIKGKKGTEVRLTVLKLDGSVKVVSIVRDIVELEETFAKSSVVEFDQRKFGIINLPKFYIDFNEASYRNSATDMELEIERLKKENVEGLLIDLRNNGGGSLKTAIEIAGLFIDKGPVVQVKYRGEKPNVRSDRNKKVQWDGPLVIMVNELSASASEIFAAAMQDYNRAVIIGSKQSFGKGTVQNVLTLNNYFNYPKDLGALKMTIQKFYRINGGSTQLKGVVSDIAMPDRYTYLDIGERDENNPLAWDQIEPAEYTPSNSYQNFTEVVNNSKLRIAANQQFKLIDTHAKWLKEGRDDKTVQLGYQEYKAEIDKRQEEAKAFEPISEYSNNLEFKSPEYELAKVSQDSIFAKKRETWHNNLKRDIYVEEALAVLSELKMNKNTLLVKN